MSAIWVIVLCVAGPTAATWIWLRGWASEGPLRVAPLLALALWIGWGLWEQFVVRPGDNIRVDLVLFLPILLAATIAAMIVLARALRS